MNLFNQWFSDGNLAGSTEQKQSQEKRDEIHFGVKFCE